MKRALSFVFPLFALGAVVSSSGGLAAPRTEGWAAWRDPQDYRFHVVGAVLAPHPGYRAVLEPSAPQGINPRQLLMDLVLEERPGRWPQVPTYVPVEYEVDQETDLYTEVAVKTPDSLVAFVEVRPVEGAWKAWVDTRRRVLHVEGEVDAPNPGYQVRLRRSATQDARSGTYRLDLVLTPGKGMWAQVITRKKVTYRQSGFRQAYERVEIRHPRGGTETAPIERVRSR